MEQQDQTDVDTSSFLFKRVSPESLVVIGKKSQGISVFEEGKEKINCDDNNQVLSQATNQKSRSLGFRKNRKKTKEKESKELDQIKKPFVDHICEKQWKLLLLQNSQKLIKKETYMQQRSLQKFLKEKNDNASDIEEIAPNEQLQYELMQKQLQQYQCLQDLKVAQNKLLLAISKSDVENKTEKVMPEENQIEVLQQQFNQTQEKTQQLIFLQQQLNNQQQNPRNNSPDITKETQRTQNHPNLPSSQIENEKQMNTNQLQFESYFVDSAYGMIYNNFPILMKLSTPSSTSQQRTKQSNLFSVPHTPELKKRPCSQQLHSLASEELFPQKKQPISWRINMGPALNNVVSASQESNNLKNFDEFQLIEQNNKVEDEELKNVNQKMQVNSLRKILTCEINNKITKSSQVTQDQENNKLFIQTPSHQFSNKISDKQKEQEKSELLELNQLIGGSCRGIFTPPSWELKSNTLNFFDQNNVKTANGIQPLSFNDNSFSPDRKSKKASPPKTASNLRSRGKCPVRNAPFPLQNWYGEYFSSASINKFPSSNDNLQPKNANFSERLNCISAKSNYSRQGSRKDQLRPAIQSYLTSRVRSQANSYHQNRQNSEDPPLFLQIPVLAQPNQKEIQNEDKYVSSELASQVVIPSLSQIPKSHSVFGSAKTNITSYYNTHHQQNIEQDEKIKNNNNSSQSGQVFNRLFKQNINGNSNKQDPQIQKINPYNDSIINKESLKIFYDKTKKKDDQKMKQNIFFPTDIASGKDQKLVKSKSPKREQQYSNNTNNFNKKNNDENGKIVNTQIGASSSVYIDQQYKDIYQKVNNIYSRSKSPSKIFKSNNFSSSYNGNQQMFYGSPSRNGTRSNLLSSSQNGSFFNKKSASPQITSNSSMNQLRVIPTLRGIGSEREYEFQAQNNKLPLSKSQIVKKVKKFALGKTTSNNQQKIQRSNSQNEAVVIKNRNSIIPQYVRNYQKLQSIRDNSLIFDTTSSESQKSSLENLVHSILKIESEFEDIKQCILKKFMMRTNLIELVKEFCLIPQTEFVAEIIRFLKFVLEIIKRQILKQQEQEQKNKQESNDKGKTQSSLQQKGQIETNSQSVIKLKKDVWQIKKDKIPIVTKVKDEIINQQETSNEKTNNDKEQLDEEISNLIQENQKIVAPKLNKFVKAAKLLKMANTAVNLMELMVVDSLKNDEDQMKFQIIPKIILDWLVDELHQKFQQMGIQCPEILSKFVELAIKHLLPHNLYQELGSERGIRNLIRLVLERLHQELDIDLKIVEIHFEVIAQIVQGIVQNDFSSLENQMSNQFIKLTSVEFYLIKNIIIEVFFAQNRTSSVPQNEDENNVTVEQNQNNPPNQIHNIQTTPLLQQSDLILNFNKIDDKSDSFDQINQKNKRPSNLDNPQQKQGLNFQNNNNQLEVSTRVSRQLFAAEDGCVNKFTRNQILERVEVTRAIILRRSRPLEEPRVLSEICLILTQDKNFCRKRRGQQLGLQSIENFLIELSSVLFHTREKRENFIYQQQRQSIEILDLQYWESIKNSYFTVLNQPQNKYLVSCAFLIDLDLRFYYLFNEAQLIENPVFSFLDSTIQVIEQLFIWVEDQHFYEGTNFKYDLIVSYDKRFMTFFLQDAMLYGVYSALDTEYALKYFKISDEIVIFWMRGVSEVLKLPLFQLTPHQQKDLSTYLNKLIPIE